MKILYVKKKKGDEAMTNVNKSPNIQDYYLNQLRKDKIPVIIYLTNGVRLRGLIKGFDNFVILLKENTNSLIYKHSVSSIVPEKEIEIKLEETQ
jgi:host factor-I protein